MRSHVFGLRLWCVVNVAANIEIMVVLLHDFLLIDQPRVFWNFQFVGEDKVDLLDIFRTQLVLVLALSVFCIGVDEVDLDAASADEGWNVLGTFYFSKGKALIELSDESKGRLVFADAVKLTQHVDQSNTQLGMR